MSSMDSTSFLCRTGIVNCTVQAYGTVYTTDGVSCATVFCLMPSTPFNYLIMTILYIKHNLTRSHINTLKPTELMVIYMALIG